MKKRSKTDRGFTLVELVVVIAIIAVLAAVSVAGYYGFTAKAKESADISLVKQLDTMVKAANEEDLVNAVELRKYFGENGIEKIETQNKKNLIVYDLNRKEVELVKASEGNQKKGRSRSIDGGVLTYVYTAAGSGLELNENPSAPEELFAGKMILSTKGNSLGEFVYSLRNGNLNLPYLNELKNESNDALVDGIVSFISSALFIGPEGNPTTYNLVWNQDYQNTERTDFSTLKYAVFSEDCLSLSAQSFVNGSSIKKIIIPSSVNQIDPNTFNIFIDNDSVKQLTVAFIQTEGVEYIEEVKQVLVDKGATIAPPSSLAASIRTDGEVFVSGIKRYVDVATLDEVKTALSKAEAGDCLRLTSDITVTENINVPAGITLLIPCRDGDIGYDATGYNPNGVTSTEGLPKGDHITAYKTLTVADGAILSINGNVLVNSVSGQPSAGHFDQDVNGGYGVINLEGTIKVNAGGLLDCCGYIRGQGRVIAHNNAEVRDLYVVRNWRGGSQAFSIYPSVYPMNEYDLHNIETPIEFESGSSLVGTVKMFASGSYHYTRFPQIDNDNGLIRLKAGSKLVKTYDPTTNEAYKYGRETYTITGGATFSSSILPIVGIQMSTKDFIYPIDGDITMKLDSGDYAFDGDLKGYKFMPGARMEVGGDATLTIPNGIDVVFYDVFIDADNTGDTEYPDREAAKLVLHSGSQLSSNGNLAGLIEVSDINSPTSAVLNGTNVKSQEAKGYLTGLKTLSFNACYCSAGQVYLNGEMSGSYNKGNWVSQAEAVTTFTGLNVLEMTVGQLTTQELKDQAMQAINYYNRLVKSSLDAQSLNEIKAYESKILEFEDVVYPSVAIGAKTYSSFVMALNEVASGQTIMLLKDLVIYDVMQIEQDKDLILDLNGYRLTANTYIINKGVLEIVNGSVCFENTTSNSWDTASMNNYGVLSIRNCEILQLCDSFSVIKNYNRIEAIEQSVIKADGECQIIGNDLNSSTEIGIIADSSFSAKKACIYFVSREEHPTIVRLISNSSFTSSNENTIYLSNYTTIERMENCTIVCSFVSSYSWLNRSALTLSSNVTLGYFSGTIIANSNIGVVNSIGSNSIYFSNNTYLKNLDKEHEKELLVYELSSERVCWETNVFIFEPGYILSDEPITSGEKAGYYTTVLGYSVLYVDTQYNESTMMPLITNDGTQNLYGHQLEINYYKLAERVSETISNGRAKDTINYHYEFVTWVDKDGKEIDFSTIKSNTIAFAKYNLVPQSFQFLGLTNVSDGLEEFQYTYGQATNSLEEAALSDKGIILLKDYNGPGIKIDKTVRLNLNGHTMTFDDSSTFGFQITSEGTLDIEGENGSLIINGTGLKYLIDNTAGGTLRLGGKNTLKFGDMVDSASYLIYSPKGDVELKTIECDSGTANHVFIGKEAELKMGGSSPELRFENISIDVERGAAVYIYITSCTIVLSQTSKPLINIVGSGSESILIEIDCWPLNSWTPPVYLYLPSGLTDSELLKLICNDTSVFDSIGVTIKKDSSNDYYQFVKLS